MNQIARPASTTRDHAAAARLLIDNWNAGTRLACLPEALRPRSRAEGYAIQAQLVADPAAHIGWKIAATSLAGQRHIGVDGPLAGRLFAERLLPDGAVVPLATSLMRVAEVEFAFRFGRELLPRTTAFTVDEVMAAVASLHPAIELPDSRYTDFCAVGAAQLIADDACANLFILGPATTAAWRDVDLAAQTPMAVVTGPDGRIRSRHDGLGANVLGDPRLALAWLANEVSALGLPLRAGQVVITGTCVVPIAVEPGDRVAADWGAFGQLSVSFV
ncbi:fumarylacetoacetate hydrolase family protein [Tistrella mobilis]|uniref:2-keto-4-pentenoate hydratase n=1 Tax=Tistrella mobilis TaxID=171437 RepID=UPI0031F64741